MTLHPATFPRCRRAFTRKLFRGLLVLGLLVSVPATVSASTWTHITSGSGSGAWSTASNWSGGIPNATGAIADFSTLNITADSTVTLGSPVTVGALIFGDTTPGNNWALSGSSVTLAASSGAPVVTVNNKTATLSTALLGTGGLTKSGTGTLTLSGSTGNVLSGAINVNAGTLKAADGYSFKNVTGVVTVVSGATFHFGQNFTANNLTNALHLSGTGNGGLGALNLSYNATASGAITLNADTTISHDWNIGTISGDIAGGNYNLQLTTLASGQPGWIISGAIQTGTGGVSVTGTTNSGLYSVRLSGSNSFTGGLTINNGTVQLNNAGALNSTPGSENAVTFGAGTATGKLSLNGISCVIANLSSDAATPGAPMVENNNAAAATLTVGNSQNLDGAYAGILLDGTAGGRLAILKAGTGTLTLSGSNSYTGGTTIAAGTLALGNAANTLADTGAVTVSGGTLDLGANSDTVGAVTVSGGTIIGTGTLSGSSYDLQGGAISVVLGGTGAVTKSTGNTLTLAGASAYSGATAVHAGILTFANVASISANSTVTAATGSAIGLGVGAASGDFTDAQVAGLFNSTATVNSSGLGITLATGGTPATSAGVAIDTSAGDFTLSSALTGARDLTKLGANTLTLTGGTGNTFSGAINVNAGTLQVLDGYSFKNVTGPVTVASGATFNFSQYFTSNNLTNALNLRGSGNGDLGALNLSANATASGSITLAADATIRHDWNNATLNGNVTGANGNLTLWTTFFTQGPLSLNGNLSLGNGNLIHAGAGKVTLNGANQYNSAALNGGVLCFQKDAAMGGAGANITIASSAVAARNGATLGALLARVDPASTGAIAFGGTAGGVSTEALNLTSYPFLSIGAYVNTTYSGSLTPGGGYYKLGGGGATLTVTTSLSGTQGLIVNDVQNGAVVLTGSHGYTGSTTVTSGTLCVSGSLAGPVSVQAAGTLAPGLAGGIGSLTLASPLTVDGSLVMQIDRGATGQNADLITAPSLALTGTLTVVNSGASFQLNDTFQLFNGGALSLQNLTTLNLPALAPGLAWDSSGLHTDGTLKVVALTTVGDPYWPQFLPSQIAATYAAGNSSVTITSGTYDLPDLPSGQASFPFTSGSNFTISGSNVLLLVGKQRCFYFYRCSNMSVQGMTIRARHPSFTQGRALSTGTNADGTLFAIWQIADGYPANFEVVDGYGNPGSWFNAITPSTGLINLAAGDYYGCTVTSQGASTYKITFPGNTKSLAFHVNDWLVSRLDSSGLQDHAVFLNQSTNCTIQSVTSQGGGFATFFETSGGGNHLLGCNIQCSPVAPSGGTDLPVVACAADGFHSAGAYPGPDVENCTYSGALLDDCIAIHGNFASISSVSANTFVCDANEHFVIGDPVRICSTSGYFAQANCTNVAQLSGTSWQITLDQAPGGLSAGFWADNPKYNGSDFKILNCQLGNTRSRVIITKGDNGLISGNTLSNSGIALLIGPEITTHWQESDYSQNVSVTGNTLTQCNTGISLVSLGAYGNSNLIIQDNIFGAMNTGYAISLNGCDTVRVSGNAFAAPSAKAAIYLATVKNIAFDNNLVAYAAGSQASLSIGSSVSAVSGSANGILYSGRGYTLTNALSGLLLADPANGGAGTPLQQTSNGAACGWMLTPVGGGYCQILSTANGLALGVNQSLSKGAPLVLESPAWNESQLWSLTPSGANAIQLVNKRSTLAATVQSSSSGAGVVQDSLGGTSGQLWTPLGASSNATLSRLALSSGTLSPVFSSGSSSYTASVSGTRTAITVTPTLADSTATLTVNNATVASGTASGLISLAGGSNTITTLVTAQDGIATRSYTVTVTRLTNLYNWRTTYFPGSTATAGPGADAATPLNDGVSNLIKFATGLSPSQPGEMPGLVTTSGSNMFFSYTPSASAVADGVTFTVEYSDTLAAGSWKSDIVNQGKIGSGGAQVTATVPAGSAIRRFLHLKISGQ